MVTVFPALMVILGIELLALLALLGDRKFSLHDKIPVHWGRGSNPNLYAPRRVGLSLFPVLGTVLLVVLVIIHQPVFILAVAQLSLATCNLLYFHAVSRTFGNA
jgi:hypothetical protein